MANLRTVVRAAALAATALFAACQAPLDLPKDFTELLDGGEGFRAITSDDARLWVRQLRDPTPAGVEFWAGVLRRDFVEQRGYELLGEGDVDNAAGESGRWLEMRSNVAGERVDYLVALWVDGRALTVVEFAAPHDVYAVRVDSVRAAFETVR